MEIAKCGTAKLKSNAANLPNHVIITLNTISNIGQTKIILVSDTISSTNNKKIKIQSTYLGGSNLDFTKTIQVYKIVFTKAGQSVNLISMYSSEQQLNYWHIMNGDFELEQ